MDKENQKYSAENPNMNNEEEAKKEEAERVQVKKLLAEYNRRTQKRMEKYAEELEEDEKLKEVLSELEATKAKHPREERKAFKSITEINAAHLDELYQGDIRLSVEQAQYLVDSVTDEDAQEKGGTAQNGTAASRAKRGAAKSAVHFPDFKWPIFVPYSYDKTISKL